MDFRQAGRIRWLPEWGFLRLILAPEPVSARGVSLPVLAIIRQAIRVARVGHCIHM